MAAKMMMKFSRQSWYRTALSVLLIMCMVTTMMVATTVESEAVAVLPGLVCGAGVALTIGALLAGSGVPMSEENSAALINAFYWGCDAEQLAIIESFSPGQAIGDLFNAVSGFFTTYLNTGNLFYDRSLDSSTVFPRPSSVNFPYIYFLDLEFYPMGADVVYNAFGTTTSFAYSGFLGDGTTYIGDCTLTYLDGSTLYFGLMRYVKPFSRFVFNESDSSFDIQYNYYSKTGYRPGLTSHPSGNLVKGDSRFSPGFWDYLMLLLDSSFESDIVGVSVPVSEFLPLSTDTEKALVTTTPVYVPQTWEQLWDATPEIVRTGTFTGTGGTTDPDNPDDDTDIVVGPATGTITGDGTGTGVFEGIGKWLWEIPILAEIYALGQQIRSIVNDGFGISSAISTLVSGIQGTLQSIWTTVTDILSPVTGILSGVQSLVTSVGALASGEVPAELETRIKQFSGQIFDLLSWDEMSQSMAALENMGSGYGEAPVISINLHNLLEPAQNIGRFDNAFNNTETTVIDFKILEDERFGFMGMTLIELIRMMAAISMIWYTAWYVWEKIVPDDAVR